LKVEIKQLITPIQANGGFEVHSDSYRLQQILLNLISNALKFTDKHGTITVTCEPHWKNGDKYLQASVQDTGDGISK
jgi:signal transduction histidine kinase